MQQLVMLDPADLECLGVDGRLLLERSDILDVAEMFGDDEGSGGRLDVEANESIANPEEADVWVVAPHVFEGDHASIRDPCTGLQRDRRRAGSISAEDHSRCREDTME